MATLSRQKTASLTTTPTLQLGKSMEEGVKVTHKLAD